MGSRGVCVSGQLGLLSRQQANGVGVTNAQLRSRISSGSLLEVGTDTFRLPGAPASALADLRALMLDVGGDVASLRLVAVAGLPAPLTQLLVTSAGGHLVRVDFRFPASPVVVEVLGYGSHRTPAQLRRPAERMNALVADGLRPYQFSDDQVVDAPSDVVAQTRMALAAWS